MSQENVKRLRVVGESGALARAGGEFDPDAAISMQAGLWDPEIELDASEFPVLDISGVHRGADAAWNWWREWYSAWDTLRFEYELVDAGDRVVVLLDLHCADARRASSSRPQKARGS